MKNENKNLSIKKKLIFLVLFPVFGLICLFLVFSYESYAKYKNLEKIEKLIVLSTKISLFIHETQLERGVSSGYLGNDKEFEVLLKEQRIKTVEKRDILTNHIKSLNEKEYNQSFQIDLYMAMEHLKKLDEYRKRVDEKSISTFNVISYYTRLNKLFLNVITRISKLSENSELSLQLSAYINFLLAKDTAGIERAIGTNILSSKKINKELVHKFNNLINTQKIYMESFFLYSSPEVIDFYNKIMVGDDIIEVERMRGELLSYLAKNSSFNIKDSAEYWFSQTTSKINKLKRVDDYLINQFNMKIMLLLNNSKIAIFFFLLFGVVSILFVTILGYIVSKNIHNSIESLFSGLEKFFKYINKEISDIPLLDEDVSEEIYSKVKNLNEKILKSKNILDKDYRFLEETLSLSKLYEYALEKSNIVLRISLEKKIVYGNDLFFEISGYSKEELVNKPYSYIKYPDVNDSEIDKIWERVESGKVWKGSLKNIAKNREPFYSIATMVPIKNKKGETLEYIEIRQDITEIKNLHKELEDTQREIIYKMGEIGETRSKETGTHVKKVAEYSKLLALKSGMSEDEAELLKNASPMHDIGKIGIPDSLLNKADKLTDKEFEIMKSHSKVGYEILKTSTRPILKASAIVAYEHHERYDGTGYPRGLKGEEIHIYGRITAIADVFDALGSERCYKRAWKIDDILEYYKEQRDKQFDGKLVDIFLENIDEFLKIRDMHND